MKISIVGFGWLGEPLGKFLKKKGFQVKGSTTSLEKIEKLEGKGLNTVPFFLNPLPEGEGIGELFDTDLVILNIPPERSKPENFYHRQISAFKGLVEKSNVGQVIFISATSVYPNLNQEARESDELNQSNTGNSVLLHAEHLLWEGRSYNLTVIRLGGLLGDDRIPGKYFSGKSEVVGHAPVNYIYRHDAVRLIFWVIKNKLWNETFNGVAPFHPLRKEVYEKNAKALGFPSPISYENPARSPWKIISSLKIRKTGFTFHHHPLEFPIVFSKDF